MKKVTFVLVALFLVLPAVLCYGQGYNPDNPVVDKILYYGKMDNQVMTHLHYATNVLGGRLSGSDTYNHACEWAADTFRSWGMKVELDFAGEYAVGFNRGPWHGKMITPDGEEALYFGTDSYTAGTMGIQLGGVVIGPETAEAFEENPDKYQGKWVLVASSGRGGGGGNINQMLEEAGALGNILSATPYIMFRSNGRRIKSWDDIPTYPIIKLKDTQYDAIKEKVENDQEVELEIHVRNHFFKGPVPFRSVIGIIEGTEFPDESIVIGGHFDAFDVATGAVDNGSGFTTAMEAARLIMKAGGGKPKRTIIVGLWAAEEEGLVGSQAWIKHHPELIPKISIMSNRDGGTSIINGLSVPEAMYDDFVAITKPCMDLYGEYKFELTKRTSPPRARPTSASGTDSSSFAMQGVPSLGWRSSSTHVYRRTWHTMLDTYNEVEPEYQEVSAVMIALVTWGVANLDHQLDREGSFLETEAVIEETQQRGGRIR